MRRSFVLALGACAGIALLSVVGVAAQTAKRPDYGPPAQQVNYKPAIIPVDDARAQLDYQVPAASWLPEGARLVGAFFPMPPREVMYPNASAAALPELGMRNRVQGIGLLYEDSSGKAFTIVRSAISYGLLPSAMPGGIAPRPYGLEKRPGELQVADDGFEYVIRYDVQSTLVPGDESFPVTTFTQVTWQSPGRLGGAHSSYQLYDLQWTISGEMPEDELLKIARNFK